MEKFAILIGIWSRAVLVLPITGIRVAYGHTRNAPHFSIYCKSDS